MGFFQSLLGSALYTLTPDKRILLFVCLSVWGAEDERWHRNFEASQKRVALKEQAVEHMGGKCLLCPYDNPIALEFHHTNPREKDFEISSSTSWSRIVEELKKCVLVCSNCHKEIHAGYHPEYLVSDEDHWESWDMA